MGHPLDNPVWHALAGPHAGFALGTGAARHYPRGIASFSAPSEAKPVAYSAPGRFLGWRAPDSRPLAMAGERSLLPGYVELSASTVHPEARGRSLDASLTLRLARDALARGEAPFLRIFPGNPAARLHHRLGFRERAALRVPWHRPVAA
jgi:ribosomal protein S18 acetylase RimI-like enzyme